MALLFPSSVVHFGEQAQPTRAAKMGDWPCNETRRSRPMRIVCPAIVLARLLLPPVRAATADGEKDLKGHLNQLLEKQSRMKASGASEEELAGMRQRVVMAERELRVESAGRKVKHFRAAAEHLRQVGADDLAL